MSEIAKARWFPVQELLPSWLLYGAEVYFSFFQIFIDFHQWIGFYHKSFITVKSVDNLFKSEMSTMKACHM